MPGSFGPLAESRPGMKITICRPGRGFRKLARIPPLARWAKFWRPRCGLAIGCCRTGAFHKELSGRCTSFVHAKPLRVILWPIDR
jgi:hypothetical protein